MADARGGGASASSHPGGRRSDGEAKLRQASWKHTEQRRKCKVVAFKIKSQLRHWYDKGVCVLLKFVLLNNA